MARSNNFKLKSTFSGTNIFIFVGTIAILSLSYYLFPSLFSGAISYPPQSSADSLEQQQKNKDKTLEKVVPLYPPLDRALYDAKMLTLANNPPPPPPKTKIVTDPNTGEKSTMIIDPDPVIYSWPVKDLPYPSDGAILPFKRVIAYYGNLYSRKMGVLGEYDEDEMLTRLQAEVKKWEEADPETPVMPALHYIAVVAQGSAGDDGKYRARMPDSEIDKVLKIAERVDGIVFLDLQVGFSDLESEIPRLSKYLKLPNVHLGVDPEFSMKTGVRPGKVVGTFDAADINYAAGFLAKIVRDNNLPPKIIVVHRYTERMLTNSSLIRPLPEVQIIVHMDGWGGKAKKINTYEQFAVKQPVQFTGFKLFYKNDVFDKGATLLTPRELLELNPRPIYIQYQ